MIVGHVLRRLAIVLAAMLVAMSCGEAARDAAPRTTTGPTQQAEPSGVSLSKEALVALTAQFPDNPLSGGQQAPRLYRWVNDAVAIFVQLDNSDLSKATALRYIGVSVKGVFCAESQPGGPNGGFPHFHRLDAPDYAQGHGGPPGTPGYWLSWIAVDQFATRDGRQVMPGIDYDFSPTPPPACGTEVPPVDFAAPGARRLTAADIAALAQQFGDNVLTGGQVAPRSYRWVNPDTAIFLQFDDRDPAKATALRYIGISLRGTFCGSTQPSRDFPHFHRIDAPEYAQGHGQAPRDRGYWLLWVATDRFTLRDGREVFPGVDREFSPTPPPDC
jgi:hypothetical protein